MPKTIDKQKKYEKLYHKYNHKRLKYGLSIPSFDDIDVSDIDSRKPTKYIPDRLEESVLANIFLNPFILIFYAVPRTLLYINATKKANKYLHKLSAVIKEQEALKNSNKNEGNQTSKGKLASKSAQIKVSTEKYDNSFPVDEKNSNKNDINAKER